MPLLVTLLPLIGLSFLASDFTEWALIGLSATLGISSLCLGFREHRSRWPLGVLAGGLALLALGHMAEHRALDTLGVPLLFGGGVTIAVSHLVNRRLCLACRMCHPQEKSAPPHDN